MSTYVPQHYAAATLFRLGVWLHEIAQTLRHFAARLDAVIAARRKTLDDCRTMSEMSERELRDIGVSSAQLRVSLGGWSLQGHERLHTMEWRQPM
ncbi:MAG TPA: hypothetical protein VGK44_00845 [Casimicrobiaceae bacterium]|jgi:uncharacterized protein YjiS (DUF1127 family)